ncbi:hypothetical protein PHJA_002657900 [Phtheirospermum japonicum]|uniref:Uncharacterized protein n=1 Tax=Phtheirospermum japonicum TaxID=374723 RepID=A0A830CX57_9LAMI|nr:hypothetical protein PHJA_002657900 [Phtheirospermum japonicum]
METWSTRGVVVRGRLHWVSRWVKLNGHPERTIVTYNLEDDSFDVIYNPTSALSFFGRWAPSFILAALEGSLSADVPLRNGDVAFSIWIMRKYGWG